MKHLFIVNPTAGGRDHTSEVKAKVEKAFANRNGQYEVYVTRAPMDAAEKIVREAERGEALRVYACGGDGTFNECVCGAAGRKNVAVCPFPTGTGNDFCRMFGEEKELFRDVDALLDGWETDIDVIDCNGRYSANICSVGIDARIGTDVHKYSNLPLVGGSTGYVVSTVVNVLRGINRHMRIKCGSFQAEGPHSLVCVCNGRFYGGGFNPSLDARPDDGILDIFIIKKVNLLELILLIGRYAAGEADNLPKYVTHLRSDEIEIAFDEENVVNIDGEALHTDKVHMRLIPRGMKLVVPKGMRFFEKQPVKTAAAAGV